VGTQTFDTLAYGGTARLAWELGGNTVVAGGFDKVTATREVTISSGAVVDVVLNGTGSAVDLSDAFWTQSRSWTILTAAGINGGPLVLGTVSTDASGRSLADYGIVALQQSANAVELVFTPYTPQQFWQRASFGSDWSNPTIAGNAADPDHDGASNLIEWGLGMRPSQSDAVPWTLGTPGLPVETMIKVLGQDYLALQVRRPAGRTGITYGARVSGNLVSWDNAVQEGAPTANGDNTETVTFRDIVPASPESRRFIRLELTQ
jgi:hypothetical protein